MRVKQLSIFIENRSGRLAKITTTLGNAGVNIRAMSLADTSDFGILRLIVNDIDTAYTVLKKAGFTVSLTDVIAVGIPDTPGALGNLLTIIDKAAVNVEYMYVFVAKDKDQAILILRFDDLDKAIEILTAKNIEVLENSLVTTI